MNPPDPSPLVPQRDVSEQALRLRDARLAALEHVALGLTSTLQLVDVLERVAQMAQSLTESAHAHIFLYDADLDELRFGAGHWANQQTAIPLKPRRDGITFSVAHSGSPIFIEDAENDPSYQGVPTAERPSAFACLPLTMGERVLGTLNIGYWRPHVFDSDTRRFLDLMARYAAIAIHNAQLYEAATRSADELRRLYDTSLDVASQLDTPQLLDLIIQRAASLLHANSGNFYLYDPEADELVPCAPFGLHLTEPLAPVKPGEGATGRVFQSGQPLAIPDYDAWDGRLERNPPGRYARVLHAPVKQGDHIIGVMSVNRVRTAPAFTEEDTRLLVLFANQAAVAMENQRLHLVAVDKARMEQELQVAHRLQADLLPHSTPHVAGWEFQARWYPALETSGDFYDFPNLSTSGPVETSLLQRFLIADVAGKGVPAALFAALTRSTLRAIVADDRSPSDCLTRANRLMAADSVDGTFVTLCYGQLDVSTGELVYVNAGHNPPLWYRCVEERLLDLKGTGPALGVVENQVYAERRLQLEPGDFVLFYTDGLTDALSPAEEEFGMTRLREVLMQARNAPAIEIVAALEQSLSSFVGDRLPSDDVTLVLVKRLLPDHAPG